MYPLRFKPIFRQYIWGGQRLATVLGKETGCESCAESWEIVDHQDDQSIVEFGRFAGQSLSQLISDHGIELLGQHAMDYISRAELPDQLRGRFPLLLKFLDANRNLSVQVHPNDRLGKEQNPPDLGKTEAWYVMHADPGSLIYAGLKSGVTPTDLRLAIKNGTVESLLHCFEASAGDCVFIPAGTIHAIGKGLLIAEIQQSSDTTFRIFDWNRVDPFGQFRELHIEQGICATDFERGPVSPEPKSKSDRATIIECEKFVVSREALEAHRPVHVGGEGYFLMIAVIKGSVSIDGDPANKPLTVGHTALLPAALGKTRLVSNTPSEYLYIKLP